MTKKITLVFLLYNASKSVESLLSACLSQVSSEFPKKEDQGKWLEVIFVDDHSPDETAGVLTQALEGAGNPTHIRSILNEKNLGLSKTLNKTLQTIETPYVLTC